MTIIDFMRVRDLYPGTLGFLRQFYRHEVSAGIQVAFPTFIDDAQISAALGILVRDHTINLVDLQGGGVL